MNANTMPKANTSNQKIENAEALAWKYRHLAQITARRMYTVQAVGLEYGDFVSAANLGLCKAAERFDPGRGVKFATLAITLIRGEIREMLRDWSFYSRSVRERAQREGRELPPLVSLDERVEGTNGLQLADLIVDSGPGPESLALSDEKTQALSRAMARLPDRERAVVRLSVVEERTHRDIGAAMGVSESRANQIYHQGLRRLRSLLSDEWEAIGE